MSKAMKEKNLQSRTLNAARLSFDGEIKKLSRQAKVKRIQQHQTSFTANTKGTSLGRKHKRRKRPTEKKPKTITKTVIRSYILIITLSVNRLNSPTKNMDWRMKTRACMHSNLPHHSA